MRHQLVALTLLMILLAACGGEAPATGPIALIGRFDPALLESPATLTAAAPTLWQAGEPVTALALGPAFGWAAEVAAETSWNGTSASVKPLLTFTSTAPLGSGDELYAVEVRMSASAGGRLALTALGSEGPPALAFGAPDGPPLVLGADLIAGGKVETYRIDLSRSFPMGPFSRREIERVILQPTDVAGAEVTVESVRLVFRREHLDSLPSGPGWHGLANIFRETLITRAGETARLEVEVPADAWLDLAVGTPETQPVYFEVAIARRSGEEVPLLHRAVTTPERWEDDPVDLSRFAGERVQLLLRAHSSIPGALAFWGHPTVRPQGVGSAAANSDRPQGVILIIGDTLRRDHLSLYGYERDTSPELTRLAAEGVRFDNAVAQGTWTKISVPSILTSLHPSSHGLLEFVDRLPASVTTLAEAFRDAGYATLQTSSVPFSGQLSNLQQGVEVLHEASSLPDEVDSKTGRILTDRVLDWIELHRRVPFFAVLHAMDAHSPYEPSTPYRDWWTEPNARSNHETEQEAVKPFIDAPLFKKMTMPTRDDLLEAKVDPERYVEREIGWYDGSIRGLDGEIGRLAARLKHLGLDRKVVLVFLSDHGEELLEHGQHWHGTTVYAEQTDVPLVLWAPGHLPGGVVVPQTVQLLDVMPTVLDLAGLPVPKAAQGQSLLPLITSLAAGAAPTASGWKERPAFSETSRGPSFRQLLPPGPDGRFVIVDGPWRLIENTEAPDGWPRYELFNRAKDPLDQHDLASEHPEVVAELATKLTAWRDWARARKLEPDALDGMSAEELARLRSLGYI